MIVKVKVAADLINEEGIGIDVPGADVAAFDVAVLNTGLPCRL